MWDDARACLNVFRVDDGNPNGSGAAARGVSVQPGYIIAPSNENLANARKLKLFRRIAYRSWIFNPPISRWRAESSRRAASATRSWKRRWTISLLPLSHPSLPSPTRFPSLSYLSLDCEVLIFNSYPEGTYSLQSVWPSPALSLPSSRLYRLAAWVLSTCKSNIRSCIL